MACLSTAATGTQSPETGMKTGLNAPKNPSVNANIRKGTMNYCSTGNSNCNWKGFWGEGKKGEGQGSLYGLFLLLYFRLDYGLASLRTGKESKERRQVRA